MPVEVSPFSLTCSIFAKRKPRPDPKMLRDVNLIPLSHQHQHALALCVRIHRALDRAETSPQDLLSWHDEIRGLYETELNYHFDAEEQFVFPAAEQFSALQSLVRELRNEHDQLRRHISAPAHSDARELREFAALLDAHIRKEERQLFEQMQQSLSAEQLHDIGSRLNQFFGRNGVPMEQ